MLGWWVARSSAKPLPDSVSVYVVCLSLCPLLFLVSLLPPVQISLRKTTFSFPLYLHWKFKGQKVLSSLSGTGKCYCWRPSYLTLGSESSSGTAALVLQLWHWGAACWEQFAKTFWNVSILLSQYWNLMWSLSTYLMEKSELSCFLREIVSLCKEAVAFPWWLGMKKLPKAFSSPTSQAGISRKTEVICNSVFRSVKLPTPREITHLHVH